MGGIIINQIDVKVVPSESPSYHYLHLTGMLTYSGSKPCLHISVSWADFKIYPHLLLNPKLIKSESQQEAASAFGIF